jgi:hypothetical protein
MQLDQARKQGSEHECGEQERTEVGGCTGEIGKYTSDTVGYAWLAVNGSACTGMPSDPWQT